MTPYDAYRKYLAIKMHYKSDSYDYFKYNGSIKSSESKFETRKDKYFFHRLSKKENLEIFLACNLFLDPDVWIGKLFDEEYESNYRKTIATMQSLQYNFEKELNRYDDLNDALVPKEKGDFPSILKDYFQKVVSKESLVILNDTLKVYRYWDECFGDNFLWRHRRDALLKYGKFMKYDVKKYHKVLLDNYQVVN